MLLYSPSLSGDWTEERVDAVKGSLDDVLDFLAASPNDCLEGASLELGTLLLR